MISTKKLLSIGVILSLVFSPVTPVFAVSATWDGSESDLWATGGNWVGNVAPGVTGGGSFNNDTATFTGTTNTTVTVDTRTIRNITFDAAAGAFMLNGGTLILASDGSIQNAAGTVESQNLNSETKLNGDYTFNSNASNNTSLMNFGGGITSYLLSGTQTLILGGANTGHNTISGVIGNGTATVAVTKDDAGTWTLSGRNTYTGATTVNAGTLKAGVAFGVGPTGAFGNGSAVNLTGAGTLDLATFSNTIGSLSGTAGSKVILDAANLTTGGWDDTTFAGIISGDGGLIMNGFGTLTLSGANTYTGTTEIASGTLALSGGAAVVDSGAVLLYDLSDATLLLNDNETIGSLSGGGALGGHVNLNGKILTVGGASTTTFDGIISGEGGLTQAGSGTLTLTGANNYIGTTSVTAGTLIDAGSLSDLSDLTVNGATAIFDLGNNHSDTVGTVTLQGGGSITGTGTSALTSDADYAMQNGSVSAILAGGVGLNKTTAGTVTLSGANTYTGVTTISEGTLQVGDGGTSGTLGAGNVTNNSVLKFNRSDDLTVSSVISGSGYLYKNGAGTLTLSSSNTYTGRTYIGGGTVYLTADQSNTRFTFVYGDDEYSDEHTLLRVKDGVNITGDITNYGVERGTLTFDGSSIMNGRVGDYEAGGSLHQVNVGAADSTVTFKKNIGAYEIHFTSITTDGTMIFEDGVDYHALYGDAFMTTETNGLGILEFQGDSEVDATVGASGASLKKIDVAQGSHNVNLGTADSPRDVYTHQLNFGPDPEEEGASSTTVSFFGDAHIGAGGITTEWSLYGNVYFTSNATVEGSAGAEGARLGTVYVAQGEDHTVNFNGDTYLSSLYFWSDAESGAGDATVTFNGNANIDRAITTGWFHDGGIINFNGNASVTSYFDDAIGSQGAALKEVNFLGAGSASWIGKNVYADQITVGTGTVDFDRNVYAGSLNFPGDGEVQISGTATLGTVTADATGSLTLLGNGVIGNGESAIGAVGAALKTLNVEGGEETTVTINGDLYADDVNVGAGTLEMNGDLTSPSVDTLNFTADGFVTLTSGHDINANIATYDNGHGTLTLEGANVINGDIGDTTNGLKAVHATGAGGGEVTVNGDIFSSGVTVGSGVNMTAQSVWLSAKDGQLTMGGGNLTVTNGLSTNFAGTQVIFSGSGTLTGDVSAEGAKKIGHFVIQAGVVAEVDGDIDTQYIRLTGNVDPDQTFRLGAGHTLTGDIRVGSSAGTFTGNQGIVEFLGDATVNGNIGEVWMGKLKQLTLSTGTVTVSGSVRSLNYELSGATLSIGGNLTQEEGGTMGLTINGASPNSNGNMAVGGTTTLKTGSNVYVTVPIGVSIANGTAFTVIDANGFGGDNTVPTVTSNTRRYAFTASIDTGDLILTSAEGSYVAPTGATGNESAVANVLNGIPNPTGDMNTVLDQLGPLSPSEYEQALDTMHPDVSSGAADGSRSLTSQGFTTVSNRLGGARSGGASSGISSGDRLDGVGVWMQALGSNIKQGERKGVEGYNGNLFGTTIGADKVIDKHFRAGFAGSYGWARVKSKTAGSPSDDINSFQGTIYGSFDSLDLNKARQSGKKSYEAVRSQVEKSWYVDGMFAFTQNNYDSRREIWVTPANKRVAKAEHYGQQYSTNFEAGYKFVFEKTKNLEVTPFVSLGYSYLYLNKYKENGASALNLSVDGQGFNQLEQSLGTKLAYPLVNKKMGTFIPSAKAAWLYDYISDTFETTASFAGGGASFNTQGAKPARNGMLFGAELAFLNKGNVTLTGNWDIELKDQYMSNTYYGTARYDF